MELYTLGKLALPVVIATMGISALLTLVMGIFTSLKTLENVERFFNQMEENRRTNLTINISPKNRDSRSPMQDEE
ncbi:MAG: hypothetical protein HY835_10780 [Anaerolineae bacterium]|nr:hypothetical protein [Anaerolineae bacterium]